MDPMTIYRIGQIHHNEILAQAERDQHQKPLWRRLAEWGGLLILILQRMIEAATLVLKERANATAVQALEASTKQPERSANTR